MLPKIKGVAIKLPCQFALHVRVIPHPVHLGRPDEQEHGANSFTIQKLFNQITCPFTSDPWNTSPTIILNIKLICAILFSWPPLEHNHTCILVYLPCPLFNKLSVGCAPKIISENKTIIATILKLAQVVALVINLNPVKYEGPSLKTSLSICIACRSQSSPCPPRQTGWARARD